MIENQKCPYFPGCTPDDCVKCWEGDVVGGRMNVEYGHSRCGESVTIR